MLYCLRFLSMLPWIVSDYPPMILVHNCQSSTEDSCYIYLSFSASTLLNLVVTSSRKLLVGRYFSRPVVASLPRPKRSQPSRWLRNMILISLHATLAYTNNRKSRLVVVAPVATMVAMGSFGISCLNSGWHKRHVAAALAA